MIFYKVYVINDKQELYTGNYYFCVFQNAVDFLNKQYEIHKIGKFEKDDYQKLMIFGRLTAQSLRMPGYLVIIEKIQTEDSLAELEGETK